MDKLGSLIHFHAGSRPGRTTLFSPTACPFLDSLTQVVGHTVFEQNTHNLKCWDKVIVDLIQRYLLRFWDHWSFLKVCSVEGTTEFLPAGKVKLRILNFPLNQPKADNLSLVLQLLNVGVVQAGHTPLLSRCIWSFPDLEDAMNNRALDPVCPLVLSTAMGSKFSVPKETPLAC